MRSFFLPASVATDARFLSQLDEARRQQDSLLPGSTDNSLRSEVVVPREASVRNKASTCDDLRVDDLGRCLHEAKAEGASWRPIRTVSAAAGRSALSRLIEKYSSRG